MDARTWNVSDVAWLGSPPVGQSLPVTVVRDLRALAELHPLPSVLCVDWPTPPHETLALVISRGLHDLRVLVMVDTLEPGLVATAAEHDIVCLPRSLPPQRLEETLRALVRQANTRQRPDMVLLAAMNTARAGRFVVRTLDEAEGLASLLAQLCPEPERRVGGFVELLVNAIEHGNLEISCAEKRQLLMDGLWHARIQELLEDPRFATRTVRVQFERGEAGSVEFSIEDDGQGFDVAAVLKRELEDNDTRNGRGIALARLMSFDELTYEGKGNRVIGRIR